MHLFADAGDASGVRRAVLVRFDCLTPVRWADLLHPQPELQGLSGDSIARVWKDRR
jgi:hypothetical protein